MADGKARWERINYSLVVLIPKKEAPVRLGDYSPIALLNTFFKIVARVLTNGLSPVMEALIGDYRSGFIKDKSIFHGTAITKELVHQCRR